MPHESPFRQQHLYNSDRSQLQMPQLATELVAHASEIPPGRTETTTESLRSPKMCSRDPNPASNSYYTGAPHNSSHSFTPMVTEIVNLLSPQSHHTATLRMQQWQFNEEFHIMQQQIQERHLLLEEKIQEFLASFEQRHDNPSQTASSPPDRNPTIDAIYSRSEIPKYFFAAYCNPTQPESHWHYCIRRPPSQNIRTAEHLSYDYSTTARQLSNGDKSTAPSTILFCEVP